MNRNAPVNTLRTSRRQAAQSCGWPLFIGLLCVWWVADAHAQFNQQQGGRPGGVQRGTGLGGGRVGGGGAGGAGARQYYPPGTVGEAIVTADPETRRLIVITDEETSQYVSQ